MYCQTRLACLEWCLTGGNIDPCRNRLEHEFALLQDKLCIDGTIISALQLYYLLWGRHNTRSMEFINLTSILSKSRFIVSISFSAIKKQQAFFAESSYNWQQLSFHTPEILIAVIDHTINMLSPPFLHWSKAAVSLYEIINVKIKELSSEITDLCWHSCRLWRVGMVNGPDYSHIVELNWGLVTPTPTNWEVRNKYDQWNVWIF